MTSTKPAPGSPDPPRKLDIFLHDRHSFRVYGAEVGIFEQVDEESFRRLLQRLDGLRLPPHTISRWPQRQGDLANLQR
jgi:hypothetical protein